MKIRMKITHRNIEEVFEVRTILYRGFLQELVEADERTR